MTIGFDALDDKNMPVVRGGNGTMDSGSTVSCAWALCIIKTSNNVAVAIQRPSMCTQSKSDMAGEGRTYSVRIGAAFSPLLS